MGAHEVSSTPQHERNKRQKTLAMTSAPEQPDFQSGVDYWDTVDASVDGVLGGFGNGPVPHIDQLSSRLLLLRLLPQLHTFPSPLAPAVHKRPDHRLTALDVGAGIGRVSRNVLSPLFDEVIMIEPVAKFVQEAYRSAAAGDWRHLSSGKKTGSSRLQSSDSPPKRVHFVRGALQNIDPGHPFAGADRVGVVTDREFSDPLPAEIVYDVIWCQWCLGHLSHSDLVTFFKRGRSAIRSDILSAPRGQPGDLAGISAPSPSGFIVVKENVCDDATQGTGEVFDEVDSSITRSSSRWLQAFTEAGLHVVVEEVQDGMPSDLYRVKTWVLQ